MNVLLIGSGGREHALAWKLSASPLLSNLYCAPGNGGIADVAECVPLAVADHTAVMRFCKDNAIDLVVVGPEAPLVAGLVDDLATSGIKCFGPSQAAAQLEGSKGFTKDLCAEFNIPTAAYGRFTDAASAMAYAAQQKLPIVVKADGLAAGKGVTIAETHAEADAAIEACFEGAFGAAGSEVVIEEFLVGEEASFFALCDGKNALPLVAAQDHKRVGDGDTGPNTGGMGAYSPAAVVTPEMSARIMDEIINPTVAAMQARGIPFKGVLFAGLMITADGPKLIEYNVRFGDPETQVLMLRLKSDLLLALLAATDGVLDTFDLRWYDDAALTVVLAANGYPASPDTGTEINGVEKAAAIDGVEIFHAGTRRDGDRLLATGGRVLNVTAIGKTVAEAQARAYQAATAIDWPGGFYRNDIGWRAVEREKASR
ncbi:phosphoribosylamine--glycine ligase [Hyphomicrobium sulfonivorans]|uniref:phosphoribosylamine--glycine ligase n=1 Tax=Hyphomicrobium sulfonivorans TaxID=121290 RepID=UPI00156FE824|nr:phosphoribosylamine--glycine ligase [Hyphomicrobium sulfonivorans]MBI1651118.1 phosphoribosylamine--glycine ligase [Hyphomicrobium sulfonivorans]NSL72498.1 phosphoribosylamine--glycine ligase [Hyphomicrobium sulfonivorans]